MNEEFVDLVECEESVGKENGDATRMDMDMSGEGVRTLKKAGRKAKAKLGAGYEEYQREDIIDFIQKVEKHPVLYDASTTNSHRREILQKVFDEIEKNCSKFMPRGKNGHGNTAKKLWQQLLEDYKKFKKRILNAASGSGVNSLYDFPYEKEMAFVDAAVEKRMVENTYILGTREHHLVEAKKSGGSLSEKKFEALALHTPKRPRVSNDEATPVSKRSRKGDEYDALMEQLKRTDEQIVAAVKGGSERVACKSDRLCTVFGAHTAGWDEVDRYLVEAQLVSYIKTLKPPSQSSLPSSSLHSHYQEGPQHTTNSLSDCYPDPNIPSTSSSIPSCSQQSDLFDWNYPGF